MSNRTELECWAWLTLSVVAMAGCTTSETVNLADYGVHEVRLQPAGDPSGGAVEMLLRPHPDAGACLELDHDSLSATIDGQPLELVQEAREETLPRAGALCHHAVFRSAHSIGHEATVVVEDPSHRITFELRDPFPEPTVSPLHEGSVAPGETVALAWTPTGDRIELDDGFPLLIGVGNEPAELLAPDWEAPGTMTLAVPEAAAGGAHEIWLQGFCHAEVIACEGVELCRASTWFDLALPLKVAATS